MDRRKFVTKAGTASALSMPPGFLNTGVLREQKIRLAMAGGGFGAGFTFPEYPDCIVRSITPELSIPFYMHGNLVLTDQYPYMAPWMVAHQSAFKTVNT